MKQLVLENRGVYGGIIDEGIRLARIPESEGGWLEYFDEAAGLGIKDEYLLASTALMLENEKRWMARQCSKFGRRDAKGRMVIDETTRAALVGGFSDYLFPIVRAAFPTNVINELVSVQPTTRRTSTVMYWNYIVGRTKGSYVQGQRLFDANRGRQDISFNYSNNVIDAENVGAGTGASATIAGTLKYNDGGGVIPGTVAISAVVSAATVVASDNGQGGWLGGLAGTINYATGAFSVTYGGNVDNGVAVIAAYKWDSEGSTMLPEIDVQVITSTVETERRAMKINYSTEAMQDAQAEFGVALEPQLVSACAENMNYEIARQIIHQLWLAAGTPTITFPLSPPAQNEYNQQDHFKDLIFYLNVASNTIQRKTQKAYGNWIIVDEGASNMIESLPAGMFEAAPRPANIQGVHFIGTLMKRYRVYKDLFLKNEPGASAYGNLLMGFKGTEFWQAGFVWSPYQLLYTTDSLTTADFLTQKGMASRYATKMVNADMYLRINLGA